MDSKSDGTTILVLEDEASVRKLVRTALRGAGYNVLEAGGGLEAISLMLTHRGELPLAVLDISMPGVNGLDFANQLAIERPDTVVLYISGLTGSVALDSISRIRPRQVLPKPFTGAQLVTRVRELLAQGSPAVSS